MTYSTRTRDSFKEYSQLGSDSFPYMGLKGEALISKFIHFPNGILIDSMHLIDLGIFKRIMSILFDTFNKDQIYYMGVYFSF